jgi:hypothetical protein
MGNSRPQRIPIHRRTRAARLVYDTLRRRFLRMPLHLRIHIHRIRDEMEGLITFYAFVKRTDLGLIGLFHILRG